MGAKMGLVPKLTRFSRLSTEVKERWVALEGLAPPNPFLSYDFIAASALAYGADPLILTVHDYSGTVLVALSPLEVKATRVLPVAHLRSYRNAHSFSSGMLANPHYHAPKGGTGVLRFPWGILSPMLNGFEFSKANAGLETVLGSVSSPLYVGGVVKGVGRYLRPALELDAHTRGRVKELVGKKFNEYNRQYRRLSEQGSVHWRVHRNGVPLSAINTFLTLEHLSWKGGEHTSMLSTSADALFFHELVRRLDQRGQVLFTELVFNDVVIASTVNFVDRDMGFSFKIAWHPDFKKFGPGILNEIEFMKHAHDHCPQVRVFDSCCSPGSFIEQLWTKASIPVETVVIPTTGVGRVAFQAAQSYRARRRGSVQKDT